MPLLDAFGQILGDLGFDASEQDGAQTRGEALAGDAPIGDGFFAVASGGVVH